MASSTTATPTATAATAADIGTSGGALLLDSIPIVDLRLFCQSEIYALSLCSSSAFDPDRCDDVVIPKIDRSVFNESAGSRKQTYSRLRLAPPPSFPSAAVRRRNPHLHQSPATLSNTGNNTPDLENGDNAQMLTLFKKLFASNINLGDSFLVKVDHANPLPPQAFPVISEPDPAESTSGRKLKHDQVGVVDVKDNVDWFSSLNDVVVRSESSSGRKRKHDQVGVVDVKDNVDGFSSLNDDVVRENLEGKDMGIMNRDGVAVDFAMLGLIDHPYLEEIGRRTEGLWTVEELVRFLGGFKGRWDSSRKKKRTVDASEFGRALPTGWKLLLSIQKKNDRACLCCTRYISPSGRQFMSCKEAASYLLTLTGAQDTQPSTYPQHNENAGDRLTSIRVADIAIDVDIKEYPSSHTPLPAFASTISNQEMQVTSDVKFLSNERLGETLHCDKCNVTFCEKDESLHYRSSVHQRNKYKNVVPITCINGNRGLDDSSKSHDEKTHVVINSATEGPASIKNPVQNAGSESHFGGKQPTVDTIDNKSNPASVGEYTVDEMQFGTALVIPSLNEKERVPQKNDSEVVGIEFIKINPFENNQTQGDVEQEIPFGIDCIELGNSSSMLNQGMDPNVPRGNNLLSSGQGFMFGCGERNAQSGDENLFEGCFDVVPNSRDRTFELTSEKAEEELSEASKRTNSRTDILGPCRIEAVKHSFMGDQSSNSLPGGESKNSSHDPMFEEGLVDPTFWLGKDDLMPNTDDTNEGTSVCVWCRGLFYQEHLQMQTGAIGSLCPSCSTR